MLTYIASVMTSSSPGWPLLSGPGIEMDTAERRKIFGEIVDFSDLLRQANVTLYDISPIGPGESVLGTDYCQAFLKGIKDPGQTDLGDLGLPVLAVQSGGLGPMGTSDISGMLQQCTTMPGLGTRSTSRRRPPRSRRVPPDRHQDRQAGAEGPHPHRLLRTTLIRWPKQLYSCKAGSLAAKSLKCGTFPFFPVSNLGR